MTNSVADELEIRQLVAAYADGVNRRDKELWASTWAEDGVWNLMGNPIEGKDAVVATWVGAMDSFEFVIQLVYNGTVEIDGDTARGRWYLGEHLRPVGDEKGFFNVGSYGDEYTKVDGRWVFTRRDYHVLYNDGGAGDSSGAYTPIP